MGLKSHLHVYWASLARSNGLLAEVQPLIPPEVPVEDPIPQHARIGRDGGERYAIADAWIERRPRHLGKLQKPTRPSHNLQDYGHHEI